MDQCRRHRHSTWLVVALLEDGRREMLERDDGGDRALAAWSVDALGAA